MSNKQIINQLKRIKSIETIGKPQNDWAAKNREILLSQINPQGRVVDNDIIGYYWQFIYFNFKQKILRPTLMAVLAVSVYFVYSATNMAAKASLPGEPLYPIKVLSENLALATTISDEAKVKLKMDFVSRRGDELVQLVQKSGNNEDKKKNIAKTVKKISQDISEVKIKLEEISSKNLNNNVIDTAKKIDEKTLKVENDIVNAHAVLDADVKKEIAPDVKEAIVKTEEAGTKALSVIIDKSSNADKIVSDQEITQRVEERIKNAEASVQVITEEVKKISSSTLSDNNLDNKVITINNNQETSSATTTLKEVIKEVVETKPVLAQDTISQAKDSLVNKDFNTALQKIQETKTIVAEVIEKAQIIEQASQNVNSSSSASLTASSTTSGTSTTASTTPITQAK